jgi:hypothetical protein
MLSGFAIPTAKIATVIGISQHTLLKHYRAEIDIGSAKVEAMLIGNLMRLSKGDDGTALKATMFALCARFGWSAYVPRPELELGKKEARLIEAQTAHEGSDWGGLVN